MANNPYLSAYDASSINNFMQTHPSAAITTSNVRNNTNPGSVPPFIESSLPFYSCQCGHDWVSGMTSGAEQQCEECGEYAEPVIDGAEKRMSPSDRLMDTYQSAVTSYKGAYSPMPVGDRQAQRLEQLVKQRIPYLRKVEYLPASDCYELKFDDPRDWRGQSRAWFLRVSCSVAPPTDLHRIAQDVEHQFVSYMRNRP